MVRRVEYSAIAIQGRIELELLTRFFKTLVSLKLGNREVPVECKKKYDGLCLIDCPTLGK
jgi:hypothetical protein